MGCWEGTGVLLFESRVVLHPLGVLWGNFVWLANGVLDIKPSVFLHYFYASAGYLD